ncbi:MULTISPECIES: MFS transporter [Kitasatospora]|uniref:Putative major facilitator superfamily transporter n=1 Tax=Kitasatospora setae (strain ATCC 33774 / DSM 43861 / JCM 3304 / KCC A-0304 / NBRC 14216 / KM-6054) TaxID=452652 RepID=E4NFJ6_KITSK|nr:MULTISPECIES: MFS transporter [Kitasatospora]BAJ30276.1 putative major facilitator superfamily transporter [Kitasatospora setae KM-6054]
MGYAALLRAPHVARLLFGTLLGRLPAGMTALVIALALREAGTPYSRIGLATAAYAIAAAVGGPVLGRIVDLTGQPRVLVASAALAGTGYALLALAPGDALAAPLGAAVAGLCMPPLEPCLRSLWPDVVAEDQLDTAYAFDSASQQVLYVAGPLAVAGIAGALSPTAALWTAAVLGLLGALVVAGSAPARAWQAPPRAAGAGLLGPLRSPGLVLLLLGLAGAGWAVGAQNVLFIAYAEQHPGGLPGGAGTLLALAALAGLLGALGYGAARWRAGTATRTWVLALGMAACYLPLLLLPGPWPMAAAAFVSGLGLAPLLAAAFVLVAELAPTGTVTEAFAWLVTLFATGNAAGYAVSGALVDGSLHAVALCAVGGITLGGALLLATRTRLRPAAAVPLPA